VGVSLMGAASVSGTVEGPVLRFSSPCGQQLNALALGWPELGAGGRVVGIYQALGPEKRQAIHAACDLIDQDMSFEALRPAAMIFAHLPYGPFAQLAIERQCLGPFLALEGDELAGSAALMAAMRDLERGRCDEALVGGYVLAEPSARLIWLRRVEGKGLTTQSRRCHGFVEPPEDLLTDLASGLAGRPAVIPVEPETDPHGLAAIHLALSTLRPGFPVAVWSHSQDGRGLLLGIEGGA